jgi:hypothetical protein
MDNHKKFVNLNNVRRSNKFYKLFTFEKVRETWMVIWDCAWNTQLLEKGVSFKIMKRLEGRTTCRLH